MSVLFRLLSPVVPLRKEESTSLLLMFLYSFLAMTSYNIVKPVTQSKFIDSLGAVYVPVNPLFKEHELVYELNDAGATTIVVQDQLAPLLMSVRMQTRLRTIYTTSAGAMLPDQPTLPLPAGLDAPPVAVAATGTTAH